MSEEHLHKKMLYVYPDGTLVLSVQYFNATVEEATTSLTEIFGKHNFKVTYDFLGSSVFSARLPKTLTAEEVLAKGFKEYQKPFNAHDL